LASGGGSAGVNAHGKGDGVAAGDVAGHGAHLGGATVVAEDVVTVETDLAEVCLSDAGNCAAETLATSVPILGVRCALTGRFAALSPVAVRVGGRFSLLSGLISAESASSRALIWFSLLRLALTLPRPWPGRQPGGRPCVAGLVIRSFLPV
jgi:hypothetical protein